MHTNRIFSPRGVIGIFLCWHIRYNKCLLLSLDKGPVGNLKDARFLLTASKVITGRPAVWVAGSSIIMRIFQIVWSSQGGSTLGLNAQVW
jgi:hypothetical protein